MSDPAERSAKLDPGAHEFTPSDSRLAVTSLLELCFGGNRRMRVPKKSDGDFGASVTACRCCASRRAIVVVAHRSTGADALRNKHSALMLGTIL